MNRSYPIILISITLLLFTAFEGRAATFSGRVVDESGAPVSGVKLGIPKVMAVPTLQEPFLPTPLPSQETETDENGEFIIRDVAAPAVQLMLLPMHEAPHEIRKVKIDGLTFYLMVPNRIMQGFDFVIPPGTDVTDVEITVRERMRIRGRVLAADGTPLRNAEIMFWLEILRGGGSHGTRTLDADGYFVEYVQNPIQYTITVSYGRQSVTSEARTLKDREQHDDLVFTLDVDPADIPEPPVARFEPMVIPQIRAGRLPAAFNRNPEGMWAINPANRHAYKRIYAGHPEEARDRALAQDAHLVTINDADEQAWLLEVFGKENFWIGAIDTSDAENPRWGNGEPLTYTNWHTAEYAESLETDAAVESYVALVGITGKWQIVREEHSLFRLTKHALLEKPSFLLE